MIILWFMQFCFAQKDDEHFSSKSSGQKQGLSYFFRIVNIKNVFAIIEDHQKTKSDNELQIRFLHQHHSPDFYNYQTFIGFQEIWEIEKQFDDEWRLNQIANHISNRQTLLLWSPNSRVKIMELIDNELSAVQSCLAYTALAENSKLIQYIMMESSKEHNNLNQCQHFEIFRVSIIKNSEFISFDFEKREITLIVQYNSAQQLTMGDRSYSNCRIFFDSINFEFMQYLGFKMLNINLLIIDIQESINCTFLNSKLLVSVNIKESFNITEKVIDYIFSNFQRISITNAKFKNRLINLVADTILLTHIEIQDNPEIILINCNSLQIRYMRIDKTFTPIRITSDDLIIMVDDCKFSDININLQYSFYLQFIRVVCNSLKIQLNSLSINNSSFVQFYFISFATNITSNTTILVSDLNIQKSSFLDSSICPLSNNIKVYNSRFFDVEFIKAQFFISSILKIYIIQFVNCQMQDNTRLFEGYYMDLQNQSYLNCTFFNSFILTQSAGGNSTLFINHLSLNQICGNFSNFYLIYVFVEQPIKIQNIFVNESSELSLFSILGIAVKICTIQINHTHSLIINNLITVSAYQLTIHDMILYFNHIGPNQVLQFVSQIMQINNLQFINLISTIQKQQLLTFSCQNLTLQNIIFTQSGELLLNFNTQRIEIDAIWLSIVNFTVNYHYSINLVIHSQLTQIDRMIVSVNYCDQYFIESTSERFMLQNSIFIGLKKMLYIKYDSSLLQTSRAELKNNTMQSNIFAEYYLFFKGSTFVSVINNTFKLQTTQKWYLIYMTYTYRSKLINNIIYHSSNTIYIIQLNESSSLVIKNMTLLGLQFLIGDSIIESTNGYMFLIQQRDPHGKHLFAKSYCSSWISFHIAKISQHILNLSSLNLQSNKYILLKRYALMIFRFNNPLDQYYYRKDHYRKDLYRYFYSV